MIVFGARQEREIIKEGSMSRVEIKRNEVENLPFGTKLKIMVKLEGGYTTAYGVTYGNKIGYTDGTLSLIHI